MLKVYEYWDSPNIVEKIVNVLRRDGLLIAPSDTVLGIFVCVNEKGVNTLNYVKRRHKKPYVVLCADEQMVRQFVGCGFDERMRKFISTVWPGPTTLILPIADDSDAHLYAYNSGIAIRIPDDERLRQVLKQTGPLFSTSANITGEKIPRTCEEIDERIQSESDLIVCPKKLQSTIASTIVNCVDTKPTVVRKGSNYKRVQQVIEDLWMY